MCDAPFFEGKTPSILSNTNGQIDIKSTKTCIGHRANFKAIALSLRANSESSLLLHDDILCLKGVWAKTVDL